MKIFIGDEYEIMSEKALDDLMSITQGLKNPVLCVASGDTPAGLYKALVNRVNTKGKTISGWYFAGLDEWVGMNGNDEGSCRFHVNDQLFYPLKVAEDKIGFFDGRKKDLDKECEHIEDFIRQHGGLDIAILGLGMNGHIGMNEPGTPPELRSHVTELDTQTKQTAQKYFNEKQQLTKGITLGLATIMEARNIFLLVSGRHKANMVQRVLEEEVSGELPGSWLRGHAGLSVYLDKEAAAFLTNPVSNG
jgi:glucosamine-6-phosphate isomerase